MEGNHENGCLFFENNLSGKEITFTEKKEFFLEQVKLVPKILLNRFIFHKLKNPLSDLALQSKGI